MADDLVWPRTGIHPDCAAGTSEVHETAPARVTLATTSRGAAEAFDGLSGNTWSLYCTAPGTPGRTDSCHEYSGDLTTFTNGTPGSAAAR